MDMGSLAPDVAIASTVQLAAAGDEVAFARIVAFSGRHADADSGGHRDPLPDTDGGLLRAGHGGQRNRGMPRHEL